MKAPGLQETVGLLVPGTRAPVTAGAAVGLGTFFYPQ